MQVKTIRYERLISLGRFENHKGSIEVELLPGESADEAMVYAQQFIDYHLQQAVSFQKPSNQGAT